MSNITTPYKIIALLLVLAGLCWYVFSLGASSRQEEIDKGVKALAECQAASKLQKDAVADLKAKGDAQDQKIKLAQAKAAKLLRSALVKAQVHEPVPQECEAALIWGEAKANELTDRWNNE